MNAFIMLIVIAWGQPDMTVSGAEHARTSPPSATAPSTTASATSEIRESGETPSAHQVRRTLERITRQLALRTRESIRSDAHQELAAWTDPRHFPVMIDVLSRGDQEAHRSLLLHLADQGDAGQEALLGIALAADDPIMRTNAGTLLRTPAPPVVRMLLARALRSGSDGVIRRAAHFAAELQVDELLPLLVRVQFITPRIQSRIDGPWQDGFVHSFSVGAVSKRPTQSDFYVVRTSGGVVRFRGLRGQDDIASVPRIRFGYEIDPLPRTPAPLRRDEVRDAILSIASEALGCPVTDPGANPALWADWYRTQYMPELRALRSARSRQSDIHRRIDRAYDAHEPWNSP